MYSGYSKNIGTFNHIREASHIYLIYGNSNTMLCHEYDQYIVNIGKLRVEHAKQVIRVKKLVGLPPPALELLASYSVSKRILCTYTHTHIQPTKNIPYTHVAVDTSIVVFRPSEPHQYSINIFTLVHTHTHKHQYHNSMSILCVFTHTCKLSQIHTSIHVK